MSQCLVLVHTVPPLLEVFGRLTAELLPGVQVLHILDEPLLERVKRRGRLAAEDGARLAEHVAEAAAVGADAVLVTCSTVSPVVDMVRPTASIPVLKIDEAMIAEAVRLGRRVGVVATAASTLEPTCWLLEAQPRGKARRSPRSLCWWMARSRRSLRGMARAMTVWCRAPPWTSPPVPMSWCWPRPPWRARWRSCPEIRVPCRSSPVHTWRWPRSKTCWATHLHLAENLADNARVHSTSSRVI